MPTPSPDALAHAFALLRGYLQGEVALAEVVAAFRALPSEASGDVAFGLGEGELRPDSDVRLEALGRALAEAEAEGGAARERPPPYRYPG